MLQLRPLDPNVPIFEQLGSDLSPVVLINLFQVAEADIPSQLKAWEDDANWMKGQPGYIRCKNLKVPVQRRASNANAVLPPKCPQSEPFRGGGISGLQQ
jgi:hypothetical protein